MRYGCNTERLESYADSSYGWIYPNTNPIDVHVLSRAFVLNEKIKHYEMYVYPFAGGTNIQFDYENDKLALEIEVFPLYYRVNVWKKMKGNIVLTDHFDKRFNSDKTLLKFLRKTL